MPDIVSEAGVYSVSIGENAANGYDGDNDADFDDDALNKYLLYEAKTGDSPEGFAYVPDKEHPSKWKLDIRDATHARMAVQAITGKFRGNTTDIPDSAKGAVKSKIAGAIRKFYSGDKQKYYLSWLHSGTRPSKGVAEMFQMVAPAFNFADEAGFPAVPLASGVNESAFEEGALFVTRPLAILGDVSDNGLVYDQTLLDAIASQAVGKPARRGHVSQENATWEYPPSVGYWVGTLQQGNTLYGKCYILPDTDFNREVRVLKAVGGGLGNSIWGKASQVDNPDGTRRSVGLKLESIDFVPPERAALEELGGKFDVTSEMLSEGEDSMAEGDGVAADFWKTGIASLKPEEVEGVLSESQKHRIAEMHVGKGDCAECASGMHEMLHSTHKAHVAEAYMKEASPEEVNKMLSEAQRGHIAESHLMQKSMKMVPQEAKMVEESHVAEMVANANKPYEARIAEMEGIIKRYEAKEFDDTLTAAINARLDWNVRTEDGRKKLDALKANLRMYTVAEMAGSRKKEDIDAAATRAFENPNFQPMAEMTRAMLAGPSAVVGNTTTFAGNGQKAQYGYDPQTGRYDPQAASESARKLFGLNTEPRKVEKR